MRTGSDGQMGRNPTNPFFQKGNSRELDDVKSLRLAKIISVDTTDMVADLELLEGKVPMHRVPLPMPMVYPGGGIIAVPGSGAIVVVGLRAQQFPLILGYYPYNTFTPDSFFSQARNSWGMPETLSEGDVYIRARSDSMKCILGHISTIAAIQATTDPITGLTYCPVCKTPSVSKDALGNVVAVNLQMLGSTFHMQSDGTIFLQSSNLQAGANGDASRLFKLAIDGPTGNVAIEGAGDFKVSASGDAFIGCKNLTLNASETLSEQARNRTYNTTSEVLETSLSRVIKATDTLALLANTVSITAAAPSAGQNGGTLEMEADTRSLTVAKTDYISVGELNLTAVKSETAGTSGDRTIEVGGDDFLTVLGKRGINVTSDIAMQSGGIVTIQGASAALPDDGLNTAPGSQIIFGTTLTAKTTGTLLIQSTGDGQITSTANLKLNGANVIFNNGTLGVARNTDAVQLNAAFTAFLSALSSWLTGFQVAYNLHSHTALAGPPTVGLYPAAGPTATTPVAGTITSASTTVKAG